ncbi:MAG TPA: GAF domain-containing protein, partial [Solirubrobacteraceae bacterium]
GALSALSDAWSLPPGTEDRLAQFADIAGTAISGAQARAALGSLAFEQAALRRVAELVARGVPEDVLFDSVAAEASKLTEDEATTLLRFDEDGCATVLASCGGPAPIGARFAVGRDDQSTPALILRTGRPARLDTYPAADAPRYAREYRVGSSVGAPITVQGRVWGMIGATTPDRRLPAAAELRLQQFAELVAAALASAQASAEVQQLADEQAALRRVAELVARGVPPEQVFAAVAVEASNLLGDAGMSLLRFQPDGTAIVVATHREDVPVGLVVPCEGAPWAAELLRTQRALRVTDFAGTPAEGLAREYDVSATLVVPIMAEGRVWGMLSTTGPGGVLPAGTEDRLAQFAVLVGTAIANAESRAELTASRARVVAAADESRRRLQRDVHDGAQQRLVQTIINLKLARQALEEHPWHGAHLIEESLLHAERASAELGDLVRGILPASLTRGGLRAGVESLCADLLLPVDVDVTAPRLPAATETTAYFVIAEALANVVKHARADSARVVAELEGAVLRVEVRDDGVGGAGPGRGSGLTGLFDRVAAQEGALVIESEPGRGTTLRATLPVAG